MSCVPLIKIDGGDIYIGDNDLIAGTPILDIKPYLAYADSFAGAKAGWTEEREAAQVWQVQLSKDAEAQLNWLDQNSRWPIRSLVSETLSHSPYPRKGHRVSLIKEQLYELRCKSWRAYYRVSQDEQTLQVLHFSSGYDKEFLDGEEDSRWNDAEEHRQFRKLFPPFNPELY